MLFSESYKKLNTSQKKAVDTLDGPVMVVAGPGTGKTQVLALRIANILEKTDTPANGILCLTFTNAGVTAMRERLYSLIGSQGGEVVINTFHSFMIRLIESNFELLGFEKMPEIVGTEEAIFLVDDILENNEWEYLKPRSDTSRYFSDLRSLISLLKRERISSSQFLQDVSSEIDSLLTDPESISSRGETKGQIKKTVQAKVEGLERTKEVIRFYELYEKEKKERGFLDYDDLLEAGLLIVSESEDVKATLRENYLYILIDEHQDSSGVQNAFIETVWKDVERPNIFVVGDDRQLIYGFSGAHVSYFENFKTLFGNATLITLYENYRSTKSILSAADMLLQSTISSQKLISKKEFDTALSLEEYKSPREEVIAAALYIKEKLESGVPIDECAILVPKNKDIKLIEKVFNDFDIPTRTNIGDNLFEYADALSFIRILDIVHNPYNIESLTQSIFDTLSKISPLEAHTFLFENRKSGITLENLVNASSSKGMFAGEDPISIWGNKLKKWIELKNSYDVYGLLQHIGNEVLLDESTDHKKLQERIEILRLLLHIALLRRTNIKGDTLFSFIEYIKRIRSYGHSLAISPLFQKPGVEILTLHGSKGLEFECVRILHVNEETLMSQKKVAFSLPDSIKEKIEQKDEAVARRELYVALTRAKKECTISYATQSLKGVSILPARILESFNTLPITRKTVEDTNKVFSDKNILFKEAKLLSKTTKKELAEIIKKEYQKINISVSLLNNFFECPWRWYFRNILKLPEEESVSLVLGSLVHKVINLILSKPNEYLEKDIKSIILTLSDKTVSKRVLDDAESIVTSWYKNYRPLLHEKYRTERPVPYNNSKEFPRLKFYGEIDVTELFPNNEVSVIDFKTGSEKTNTEIEKLDEEGRLSPLMRQLAMYTFLLEGVESQTKVIESKLLFLEAEAKSKNAFYSTKISRETIDLLLRDIKDYDESIKNGTWIDRKCYFKPWGKNQTECEYCKRAKEVYS